METIEVPKSVMKKTLSQLVILEQMTEKSLEDKRIKLNPVAKQFTKQILKSIKANKKDVERCLK